MVHNEKYIEQMSNTVCFKYFNKSLLNNLKYKTASEYINYFWYDFQKIRETEKLNNTYSGKAYEILLTFLFNRENIQIQFKDESIGVRFIKPDFIFGDLNKEHIFLSVKVSGRERWKQADWESIRHKKEHPKAICILLMHHPQEVSAIKKHLQYLSLDKVFFSGSEEIDELISLIKNLG